MEQVTGHKASVRHTRTWCLMSDTVAGRRHAARGTGPGRGEMPAGRESLNLYQITLSSLDLSSSCNLIINSYFIKL